MNPSNGRPIRVLLADDHRPFAEALTVLLSTDERLEVVGHAYDGAEAVELVQSLRPDVVLMDLAMPGMDGIEATRRIREACASTCVLILTGSASADDIRRASDVGAGGYLSKDSLSSDLIAALLELTTFTRANEPRP